MLGNNNYNTYFLNKLIQNCNVLVYANEFGLLFDKENIVSLTMTRENQCALSFAPNDNVVIEVIDWNGLSAETRYWFQNPTSYEWQNFVWLFFEVNSDMTTYGICFAVEKVEVNTKKNRAKITLCSPFRTKTSLINNFGYDDTFDTFPVSATTFEANQHTAVNLGKGLIIPNYQDYYWFDYDLVDINRNTIDVYFDELNITGDIIESEDEYDRSEIVFCGIKPKTEDTLYTETKAPEWDFWHEHLQLYFTPFYFEGKQYVASNVKVQITHSGNDVTSQFDIHKYNDRISVNSKSGASLAEGVNYVLTIKGYEAELDEPSSQNYVKSYTWVTGSQGLADAQALTREYYSHKKYIEFDCRLDPRIEPLDNIYIANLGVVKVEKVTMKFNGAFNGKIKGRLIQDTKLIAPVISDLWNSNVAFRFTVENKNPVAVNINVQYSGGEYTALLMANSSRTITQNDMPNLLDSFIAKDMSSLNDAVEACFPATTDFAQSSYVTILERDD